MADQSITDLIIELDQLRARNNAMREEITTFLGEVGAPNLVEARDRYRRFAAAAIDLPSKIERLQSELRTSNRMRDEAEQRTAQQLNIAKELRNTVTISTTTVAAANARINVARAAIVDAKDLLESPMYASMLEDSRRTIRSLDSALREITTETPVVEEETNAPV